jgi:hypothetical protein
MDEPGKHRQWKIGEMMIIPCSASDRAEILGPETATPGITIGSVETQEWAIKIVCRCGKK